MRSHGKINNKYIGYLSRREKCLYYKSQYRLECFYLNTAHVEKVQDPGLYRNPINLSVWNIEYKFSTYFEKTGATLIVHELSHDRLVAGER